MSKTKSGDATRIGALQSWLGQREDEMAALLRDRERVKYPDNAVCLPLCTATLTVHRV